MCSLSPGSREAELRANARKNYDQCAKAANQITAIVAVYMEHHCPRRASVFLCFYVFTAAIMHVSTREFPPSFTVSFCRRLRSDDIPL